MTAPTREQLRRVVADINRRLEASGSPITIDEALAAAYAALPQASLELTRMAFTLDRDQAGAALHTRQFCESRIALLEQLLPPAFTCQGCGFRSYHPKDLAEGYCARCHDWTGRPHAR